MNWHWSALWTMDPDSVWVWVLGVVIAIGILLAISFVSWCLDEPRGTASHQSRAEVARLGEYRNAIDEVYDRAEHEVQRIVERGDGG